MFNFYLTNRLKIVNLSLIKFKNKLSGGTKCYSSSAD